jgi:hypothetical protein
MLIKLKYCLLILHWTPITFFLTSQLHLFTYTLITSMPIYPLQRVFYPKIVRNFYMQGYKVKEKQLEEYNTVWSHFYREERKKKKNRCDMGFAHVHFLSNSFLWKIIKSVITQYYILLNSYCVSTKVQCWKSNGNVSKSVAVHFSSDSPRMISWDQ